jgi:hypothetical protein
MVDVDAEFVFPVACFFAFLEEPAVELVVVLGNVSATVMGAYVSAKISQYSSSNVASIVLEAPQF